MISDLGILLRTFDGNALSKSTTLIAFKPLHIANVLISFTSQREYI